MFDAVVILSKAVVTVIPWMLYYGISDLVQGIIHKHTYTAPSQPLKLLSSLPDADSPDEASLKDARNIVILGASFAGCLTAQNLAKRLPTGYRIVLVEKNDAFHHIWNLPRYTALPPDPPRTARAFIPYGPFLSAFIPGEVEMVYGEVVKVVSKKHESDDVKGYVQLATGEVIEYCHLVVAMGGDSSRLAATTTAAAQTELKERAAAVQAAKSIVIIGGGAVGVELATDIKSQYGDTKSVTLIHAHEHLLDRFGVKLHNETMAHCKSAGIRVILGQRAEGAVEGGPGKVTIPNTGEEITYDLLIKASGGGSHKASGPLRSLLPPSSFNPIDSRVRTSNTLQVLGSKDGEVFACGDIADPEVPEGVCVPKMGRAAHIQAIVAATNLGRIIQKGQHTTLTTYTPMPGEGSIKLTLGLREGRMWMKDGNWESALKVKIGLDLDAAFMWKFLGAKREYAKVNKLNA